MERKKREGGGSETVKKKDRGNVLTGGEKFLLFNMIWNQWKLLSEPLGLTDGV